MMSIFNLKSLPTPVKNFLLRCLLIFIIWKLIYHIVLFPIRMPDKQLTNNAAFLTVQLLHLTYPDASIIITEKNTPLPKKDILLNNKKVVGIADGCNGLELYVLYLGFLIAFSAKRKDLLLYGFGGLAIIFILNIFRCYLITLLNISSSSLSEVAHHYIFKLFIYGVMFFLWMKYTKLKYSYG